VEIFCWGKLCWVDEEADNQGVSMFSPLPHKGQMCLMKVTHGGNKGNGLPLSAQAIRLLVHSMYVFNNLDTTLQQVCFLNKAIFGTMAGKRLFRNPSMTRSGKL
jgi:hypothetical protein